ncbi:hypothetical protein [Streptomyces sp. S.PB5]|uniref:hypothetical protein n=1 Tax=Streptomyces sp. S.PB5 TaxID=3020844 RepID=UPI0025AEF11B|nr:hypothetical protein [Streptomyces sp. S.PB5]MDN3021520.1 hypothetical protein [Streptomyces sp. S.PB5]
MPTPRLPTAAGCTLHDAGHEWDAVRVPRQTGLAALAILGTRCGAVVEDPLGGVLYYFVPVGTTRDWDVDNTRALGEGGTVTIPPPRRTSGPGPFWRMCPGDDRWLTDPAALAAAISDAFGPRLGSEQAG